MEEKNIPLNPDNDSGAEAGSEQPPLHMPLNIKENAERLPLYEELSVVLQNVLAIRYPQAKPEEREAVKQVTQSDTRELILPKVVNEPRSRIDTVEERKATRRKEQMAREVRQRLPKLPD